MMYTPDRFAILKITNANDVPHYRVFGTWIGGLVHADAWRANSGIVGVEEQDDTIIFLGESGSEYHCMKGMEGTSAYTGNVVLGWQASLEEEEGKIEVLTYEEFMNEWDD